MRGVNMVHQPMFIRGDICSDRAAAQGSLDYLSLTPAKQPSTPHLIVWNANIQEKTISGSSKPAILPIPRCPLLEQGQIRHTAE